MLQSQAKEASEGSSVLEAEKQLAEQARTELDERERAVIAKEAQLKGLEVRVQEESGKVERQKERLNLVEKGLEVERADLAKRKVTQQLRVALARTLLVKSCSWAE